MRKPVILITGANGEIGHGLIEYFRGQDRHDIVALDLKPIDERLASPNLTGIQGDILDDNVMQRIVSEFEIHVIYHLAAMLSTRSEYTPDVAHNVNVNGTLNLLKLAREQATWHGTPVRFMFPSSIAVYGLPDLATKADAGRVRERDWNVPTTMYGCNKLYCEQIGRYYSTHFRQLAADRSPSGVDFRSIRFPGLISAVTLPAGGTSDYASEMVHAAAQGQPYRCFVEESARIPFMAMPDGIKALRMLAEVEPGRLRLRSYNIGAFSLSAGEIRDHVRRAFPNAEITFEPDRPRNGIVDSWPADVDDSAAARDWDWKPDYDARRAFNEYLAPTIAEFYKHRG
jgi:nucleoside-diphosphate-sugar epimerase